MTDKGGTITSPNYPNTYPRFLNCQILLRAPYGDQVRLTLTDFDDRICEADHSFTVYDERDSPTVLADCSQTTMPTTMVTTEGVMKIVFTSDGTSYDEIKGFKLSYGLTNGSMPSGSMPFGSTVNLCEV